MRTVTNAVCVVLPPGPSQVSVNAASAVMVALSSLPDVAFAPLHAPEVVHDVALVADQVSVEVPPLSTMLGLADKLTVGALATGSATHASPSAW